MRRTTKPTLLRDVESRLARAVELLGRDDPAAAVVEAEKARSVNGRAGSVREVVGLAYYGVGRWKEALAELKAYRRITGRLDQNHLIADCLRGLGRPDEAVPVADELIRDRAAPAEVKAEAVIVAASALGDQGRYAEALAFLGRAKTKQDFSTPYTLRLWYVRGDILAKAGRAEEAAVEFRKVLRHDVGAFDAAERLAQLGV